MSNDFLNGLNALNLHDHEDSGDFSYEVIPFTNEQLSTSGLGGALNRFIEQYNKKAKPSRSEKKQLLELVKKNDSLETEIYAVDEKICSLVDRYRSDLNIFLRRKYELEKTDAASLLSDDDDPYESKRVTVVDNDELAEAQRDSNLVFKELSELEEKRSRINFNRRRALAELASVATKEDNQYYENILEESDVKIQGIENVIDVTKAKISDDEKDEQLRSLKDLQNVLGQDFSNLISYEDDEEYEGEKDFENPDYTLDEYVQMGQDHGEVQEIEEIAEQFEENYDNYMESKLDHVEEPPVETRALSIEEIADLYVPRNMNNDHTSANNEENSANSEINSDSSHSVEESHDSSRVEFIESYDDEAIEDTQPLDSIDESINPIIEQEIDDEPEQAVSLLETDKLLETEESFEEVSPLVDSLVHTEEDYSDEIIIETFIEVHDDAHDVENLSPVEKAAKDDNDYVQVRPHIFEELLKRYGLKENDFS